MAFVAWRIPYRCGYFIPPCRENFQAKSIPSREMPPSKRFSWQDSTSSQSPLSSFNQSYSATRLFVSSKSLKKTKSQHCFCSNPPWQNIGEEPLPNALVGLLTKRELHHSWCYDSSKHPHPIGIHWYECTQLRLQNVRPGGHPGEKTWQPTLEIQDGFPKVTKGIDVEKELSCPLKQHEWQVSGSVPSMEKFNCL